MPTNPHVVFARRGMPSACGQLSSAIRWALSENSPSSLPEIQLEGVTRDRDAQLALWMLYALQYAGLENVDPDLASDLRLLRFRRAVESAFEAELREMTRKTVGEACSSVAGPLAQDAARALFALAASDDSPSLSSWIGQQGSRDQAKQFLVLKSIYQLNEADPHTFAIPRLRGRPKAAMVEIQADEYGNGHLSDMHSSLFAVTMAEADLDTQPDAYIERVPAETLAAMNAMSMFALNPRLIGAIVGHLAMYEMTSSLPNKKYSQGFKRLGFSEACRAYFDVHVEADARHEQIATRDLAGALYEQRPETLENIMFGAASVQQLDALVARTVLDAWQEDRSALHQELP